MVYKPRASVPVWVRNTVVVGGFLLIVLGVVTCTLAGRPLEGTTPLVLGGLGLALIRGAFGLSI